METKKIYLGGVLIAALLSAIYLFGGSTAENTLSYTLGEVTRGDIESVVITTGTLEALNTVVVGSQLSGQVEQLFADFNDVVSKGQLIAQLDPRTFQARVVQNEADVEVAQANILQRQAEVERSTAIHDQAGRELKRRTNLREKDYISESELDQDSTTVETTRAQLQMAEAALVNARAVLQQKLAVLNQSRLDLERTAIRSPIAGTVINRNVEQGQTVAASLQAPELFQIAQDLHEMKVEASVDEADIGRIRETLQCRFSVDAYPERKFSGTIEQIRKAPDVVQNVVTYRVIITTQNRDLALLPGMTANVEIVLGKRENVLQIPNAALRFAPKNAEPSTSAPAGTPERNPQVMIDRLNETVTLTSQQQSQIKQLFEQSRDQFQKIAASGDREAMRSSFRQARAKLNSRIRSLLQPKQQTAFDKIQQTTRPGGRHSDSRPGTLWKLTEDQPVAVSVRTGLSDDQHTELIGGLSEGDSLILRAVRKPDK